MSKTNLQFTRIVLLAFLWSQLHIEAAPNCDSQKILCKSTMKCITMAFICDGDDDCGDGTDESFCDKWRSSTCSKGQAKCTLPSGSSSCMAIRDYCKKTDPPCEGPVDPRLCHMMLNGEIQKLSEVVLPNNLITETTTEIIAKERERNLIYSETKGQLLANTVNITMRHPDCPAMYTKAGDQCFSFFYLLKLSWGEAEQFCNIIDGTLAEVNDSQSFALLHKHLGKIGMASDFWLGARYLNETEGWRWLSGTAMVMGSPLWGVRYNESCIPRKYLVDFPYSVYWTNKTACYHYTQAPDPDANNSCAAVTFQHFYYITDEDCMKKKSPLCMVKKNNANSPAPTEIQAMQWEI